MARLARENSLIGRHCLIDMAVTMKPGGAQHHLPQFGIRAARRRGAGLRFAASALFSIHPASDALPRLRRRHSRTPDCNVARGAGKVLLHKINNRPEYSRSAPFALRAGQRFGGLVDRLRHPAIVPSCRHEGFSPGARNGRTARGDLLPRPATEWWRNGAQKMNRRGLRRTKAANCFCARADAEGRLQGLAPDSASTAFNVTLSITATGHIGILGDTHSCRQRSMTRGQVDLPN